MEAAPSVMVRYYFSAVHSGFFVQADLGAVWITETEDNAASGGKHTALRFLAGARGGCRLPFGRIWYVEPYIRAGYPFLIAGGIIAGYRY
jgi:hypothetical protein